MERGVQRWGAGERRRDRSREPPSVPGAPLKCSLSRPSPKHSAGLVLWEEVRLKVNKQAKFTERVGHRASPPARLLAASAPGPRWLPPPPPGTWRC